MTTRNVIGWIGILALSVFCAATAMAEEGDWLVRTRLIFIAPDDGADGALETLNAQVESDVTVEVDATYFFTEHFAVEGILATAAQEITTNDGSGESSLGSVYHAPATVLAQYHFNTDGKIKPYVGAGLNYTIFYSESGALADLDLDSGSFGVAGQAGFDYWFSENRTFNLDLKYVQIESDVDDGSTSLGTIEVNPWILGAGFGFRF